MRNKQHTEEDALLALLKGRESGLDYFFKRYYSPLTYFAFRLLDDRFKAEEIASEAFIKLWNNRERLTEHGSIKAWLYATVRNSCLDELRKVKRLAVNQEGLRYMQAEHEAPVLFRMIETETVSQIINTLHSLPPRCSQVFQMYFLQGKTCEEIARELNVSPHTVRNQKLRAIRILKAHISILLWILGLQAM